MDQRVLLIEDLIALLRVSRPTLDRWIREAREGKSDFPIPFSEPRRRMLWDAYAVEHWIAHRNQATLPVVSPIKSEKRQAREYIERQEQALKVLERHGLGRKSGKGGK
jgi:predicted DNA-binding transcriptional regulator AlpA